MKLIFAFAFAIAATLICADPTLAQNYPALKEGDWVAREFRFHTGEVMPELRIHYTTVGQPSGEPIVILHGTSGSARVHASNEFVRSAGGTGAGPIPRPHRQHSCVPDHGNGERPRHALEHQAAARIGTTVADRPQSFGRLCSTRLRPLSLAR